MTFASCVAPEAAAEATNAIPCIGAGLRAHGHAVIDNWLPDGLVTDLAHTCRSLAVNRGLKPAGIGQGALRMEDERYRRTAMRWIEPPLTGAEETWLDHCGRLKTWLNEHLLLGLFDFECQYSVYPVGGYYRRHVDRFVADDRRTVSCVLYLNEEWVAADEGALRLYTDTDAVDPLLEVLPTRGRLVAFLSDRFPHEVLPTRRERLAIAGWFRRRALGLPFER